MTTIGTVLSKRLRLYWRAVVTLLFLSAPLMTNADGPTTSPSSGDDDIQAAKSVSIASKLSANATVNSIQEISVTTRAEGILEDFKMLPGTHVQAGDLIARLTGTVRDAAIKRAQADVDRAVANLKLARDSQDGLIHSPEGLVTVSQRQTADNNLATAAIDLDTAKNASALLAATGEIRSPADGTITAVLATEGQQLAADIVVLRLQPANALWLEGLYWGGDTSMLSVGMHGRFTPGDGSAPVDVRVVRIVSPERPDGSTVVACEADAATPVATSKPSGTTWRIGQAGTLVIMAEARKVIEVPTSALIMSAGQWWLVLRTHDGEQPRQVDIGAEDGLQTIIRSGVSAGESIVISDAYLHFHRDFAKQYQQPD